MELEKISFAISVPIPIPIPMPRFQCLGLQMAVIFTDSFSILKESFCWLHNFGKSNSISFITLPK